MHLAGYREQGVLRRFRASAVRPTALVGAHMAVTVVIATAGAVMLTILSVVAYDAALPEDWVGVIAAFLLTAVSFAGLGALLGFLLTLTAATFDAEPLYVAGIGLMVLAVAASAAAFPAFQNRCANVAMSSSLTRGNP